MSRNYKFHNPEEVYFESFAVVEWINVFTRNNVDLKSLPHEKIRAAAWRQLIYLY